MNFLALFRLLPAAFRIKGEVGDDKAWYASKTIWFNLIVFALDVSFKVFGFDLPVSGEAVDAIAVGFAAVGNVVLRFLTDKPLRVPAKGKDAGGADVRRLGR